MLFRFSKSVAQHTHISSRELHSRSSDAYANLLTKFAGEKSLHKGRVLHAYLVVQGLACSTHFSSKLVFLYAACRELAYARKVFDTIPNTDVRRWVALIGACGRCSFYQEALEAFSEMQREGKGKPPSKFVLPTILKACGHLCCKDYGMEIHAAILRHRFESDDFIRSSLINMYSKCGSLENARRVFNSTSERDLVSLNTMVLGYTQSGFAKEAMDLVEEMCLMGLKPNLVTWNTLIAGFSAAGNESMASGILQLMQKKGVEPDAVSWTSIISGLVQNFQYNEAFRMFKLMMDQGLGLYPNSVTISALLPACAGVGDLSRGKEIHGYAFVVGVEDDIYVRSALVDMYAKCGSIFGAKKLFFKIPEKTTVTWNSMIFGYSNHGYCREAIELFHQMEAEKKEKPTYLTFIAALTACSHAGMVELGQDLFDLMQHKYGIKPRLEHYACMVDLFGRAGKLSKAYDLIMGMPIKPDLFVWGALLGACRIYGNIELAEVAAKHLSELEPESAGSKLLLTNLYADAGVWGNVTKLKKIMKTKKVKNFPGCSWIGAVRCTNGSHN